MMEGRRNGSVASSKRSGTSPAATQANAGKSNATTMQSAPMQKSKKSGGFLGFLNCCASSDNANGVDDEVPMPVKKVPAQAPAQTTPGKPESIPLQPVPSRPTVPLPEKNTPRPLEPVQNPATDQEDTSYAPSRSKQENVLSDLDHKASSKDIMNQPLPALPQDVDKGPRDQNSSSNPSVIVQAPTPIRPKQEDTAPLPPPPTDQENISRDTEMTDAPPISAGETKAVSVNHHDAQSNATILPPPPPLPAPESVKDPANAPQEPTTADPEEKQQWLLPPIEPRFHGKKCLVLDLDETLVHSSFKVCSVTIFKSLTY
jgi:RNA polymerase II subunit A small phosphatase-like protein